MKPNICATLVLLAASLTMNAGEKWQPTLGARLGMDLSIPSGAHNFYKTGAGVNAGVICKMPLPRNFYFEPGLSFVYTAMTAKDLVSFDNEYFYEGAANVYTLSVPLNFGYSFDVNGNMSLDVFTGPRLNINLSARQDLDPNFAAPEPVPDRTINLFDHGWKRVDASWGFGLSATFAEHYYIGITAGVAFTPLADYGDRDKKIRVHRNTVALSLGYNF